jgi:DNA-binding FadR family transcriptional regulator
MLANSVLADRDPPAVDRIVAGLTDLITGHLGPGRRLPSEADLATAFEVNRLTVREAVKVLRGRGLVDLARGRRAIVREPDGSVLGDLLAAAMKRDAKSLFDLIEVRQALEIQSAALSAERINRAAVSAIESTLIGMRSAATAMEDARDRAAGEERFHQWDVDFHEALGLASGNRMLGYLLEAMAKPLRDSFHLSLRGQRLRGHTPAHTIAAHERIFACVKAGDGRGAAQAMRAHLKDAVRDVSAALSLPPEKRGKAPAVKLSVTQSRLALLLREQPERPARARRKAAGARSKPPP